MRGRFCGAKILFSFIKFLARMAGAGKKKNKGNTSSFGESNTHTIKWWNLFYGNTGVLPDGFMIFRVVFYETSLSLLWYEFLNIVQP